MNDYRSRLMAQKIGPKGMEQLTKAINELKIAMETHDEEKLKKLEKNKALFLQILEYLILNQDNPNIDQNLIAIVMEFLGLKPSKSKSKKSSGEVELEDHEHEMTEEERKQQLRFIFYEAYKILNPHALAGETPLQNFIKNVKIRGIEEALKYEGSEYAKNIDPKELQRLDHSGRSFVEELEKNGFKGFGRGL